MQYPSYNLMIDLETMGLSSNAAIMSIAAVPFILYNDKRGEFHVDNECKISSFYGNISLHSCVDKGMSIDPDTVVWWLQQNDNARSALFTEKPSKINTILDCLLDWIRAEYTLNRRIHNVIDYGLWPNLNIWSHGKDFDVVVLANAFKVCNKTIPWKYNKTFDTRTLFNLANIDFDIYKDKEQSHNALYDATLQAQAVIDAFAKIKGL